MREGRRKDQEGLRGRVLRRIRDLRLRKGLSQKAVAHRAGMTQSAYSRFEGGRKAIDLDSLEVVARVMDAEPEAVLARGDGIPSPQGEEDRNEEQPIGSGRRPCGCFLMLIEERRERLREREEILG